MSELYKKAGSIEDKCLKAFLKEFKYVKNVDYTVGNIVYDAIINDEIMVEVKVRTVSDYVFNLIKNEGAILEYDKHKYLMKAKERMDCKKVLYINFYPNQNRTYVFNLQDVTLNMTEKVMNKQTYSVDNTKIKKKIYLLDLKEGKEYKYYE